KATQFTAASLCPVSFLISGPAGAFHMRFTSPPSPTATKRDPSGLKATASVDFMVIHLNFRTREALSAWCRDLSASGVLAVSTASTAVARLVAGSVLRRLNAFAAKAREADWRPFR